MDLHPGDLKGKGKMSEAGFAAAFDEAAVSASAMASSRIEEVDQDSVHNLTSVFENATLQETQMGKEADDNLSDFQKFDICSLT
jgi:hypothetical protein